MRHRTVAMALGMAAVIVGGLAGPSAAFAQTAANVAVVINTSSSASVRIGEYYVEKRAVPPANVIRLQVTTDDRITRAEYLGKIEGPIAAALNRHALQDQVLYIVLTKGIPLRISGTEGRTGTSASVDSELTLLYRRMTGVPVASGGPTDNPYYLGSGDLAGAKPFSHRAHDIFLVTRLDAFSVDEALALIDRGARPSDAGAIVLDQRAEPAAALADGWMAEAARSIQVLRPDGPVLLEDSPQAAVPQGEVLGYYSWGSTDRSLRRRTLQLRFVPGSLAATLVSGGARTFQNPPDGWQPLESALDRTAWFAGSSQSLVGDLIREGATGVLGNVSEPYLHSAVRPQILFPAYLSGFNLAEAFYLALPHVGWQSIVIGDPLCRPFTSGFQPEGPTEGEIDATTGWPSAFLNRRLAALRADISDASDETLLHIAAFEARLARDDHSGAKASLEKASLLAPDLVSVQLQLALLYEEHDESLKAIEGYRRVLALQPRNVIALNNLAYSLATRTQDLAEAQAVARQAYALAAKDSAILDTLGWIEYLLGNNQEAARLLRTAAARAPDHAEIRLHTAFVLARIGAKSEAAIHLAAALKSDPSLGSRDDVRELQRQLSGR